MSAPRVVSLLPSATEIVVALGAASQLVGRSEECDFPASVRNLPIVMRAKTLDRDAPSRDIDSRVSDARGRGESLYALDLELLRALQPDLIITQDLCGVCSVTDSEVMEACRVAGVQPTILSLNPRRLRDVARSILRVAEAIGRPSEGEELACRLDPPPPGGLAIDSKRVAVVEWVDPPIMAGLWVPDMVAEAGASSVGPEGGEDGQRTTWSELKAAKPDLIVMSPCSFDVQRTRDELMRTSFPSGFLSSCPDGVWLADEAYFSRPGPRLADGVDLLRRLIHHRPIESIPMPAERWRPSGGG